MHVEWEAVNGWILETKICCNKLRLTFTLEIPAFWTALRIERLGLFFLGII